MAQIIDLPTPNPVQGSNGPTLNPGFDTMPLPSLANVMTGMARSANANGQGNNPLPAYDPAALNVTGYAPGSSDHMVDPSGLQVNQNVQAARAQGDQNATLSGLASRPGTLASLAPPSVTPRDQMGQLLGGNAVTAQALAQRQQLSDFYSSPDTQKYLGAHPDFLSAAQQDAPGFMARLKPVIDAAKAAPTQGVMLKNTDGTTTYKPVADPAGFAAAKSLSGGDDHHVYAMTHPGQLTRDEFVQQAQDMPMVVAEKLWGMQHYLTPQQQLLPAYLKQLNDEIGTNQTNLTKAQQSGNKNEIEKADALLKQSKSHQQSLVEKNIEGQTYALPPLGQGGI